MTTLLLFVLVLSLLVFVHEFGHFIAARKTGMKVYEFALGFPPLAIGVYKDPKTKKFVVVGPKQAKRNALEAGGGDGTKGQFEYPATLYTINFLPLGGFCKIKGENGEEAIDSDSFGYQKTYKKVIVLVAGVVMNFVLAALLLGIGFMVGLPTDVTDGVDESAIVMDESSVVVQQIAPNSPAAESELQMGDKIVSINGELVQSVDQMIALVTERGDQELNIAFNRGGEEQIVQITPEVLEGEQQARLGIVLAQAAVVRYPWYLALWKGVVAASLGLLAIFIGFWTLFSNWITGSGGAMQVSGPVGIASIIGQSAELGLAYLINVTAMISLSLAALNILPIPALDGGRLLFVLIEGATGKKVPMKYEQIAHTFGFLLLIILLVVVTVRDVMGLF